jgi:hypothetical protein
MLGAGVIVGPFYVAVGLIQALVRDGLVHFIAGALGFTSLGVSCFVAARAMSRRNARSLARLSLFSGLAILLGFFGGFALAGILPGTAGIWFAVVVGWAWLTLLSLHLYRVTAPNT